MKSLTAIKYLCKIEQFLNIHRDYIYLSRKKRTFVTFYILLNIIISVLLYIDSVTFAYGVSYVIHSRNVFRLLYVLINLLTVSFLGPKYGAEFREILRNIHSAHDLIIKNNALLRKMRLSWILVISAFFSIGRVLTNTFSVKNIFQNGDSANDIVRLLLVLMFKIFTEIRFVFSFLICCTILTTLTLLLRNMNALIKDKDATANTAIEKLDEYATAYRQLLEAGKNLKKCFGDQILYSVMLSVSHIVCLVYIIINAWLRQLWVDPYASSLGLYGFIILFAGCLVIVAKSGQDLYNESIILNRLLVKFLCKGLKSNEAQRTTLKDFQRLVSVQPMKIHLMPNMPLGMYLMPAFLTFAINHVIVCLQLSHDI